MAYLRGEHFHHPVASGQAQLNGLALLAHDFDELNDGQSGVFVSAQIDVGNGAPTHRGIPQKSPSHRSRERLKGLVEQVALVNAVLDQDVLGNGVKESAWIAGWAE